jgi:hypothetical protein
MSNNRATRIESKALPVTSPTHARYKRHFTRYPEQVFRQWAVWQGELLSKHLGLIRLILNTIWRDVVRCQIVILSPSRNVTFKGQPRMTKVQRIGPHISGTRTLQYGTRHESYLTACGVASDRQMMRIESSLSNPTSRLFVAYVLVYSVASHL